VVDDGVGDRFGAATERQARIARNLVVRSTRVAAAVAPALPMMRSPSQWPGIFRSATSSGRSSIDTIPMIGPCR